MVNCIVIDDDQDIVDMFCDMLSVIKIDVLATGNDGLDAVKLYEKHTPDIIFTDFQMPKYDGLYAIESIKDMNADAKIIMVTGDSNARDSAILNALKVPVINKPFDIHVIKQTVHDIFLEESTIPALFDIQYKFKGDINTYSCTLTFKQYRNLKKLPIVEECEIVNSGQKQITVQQDEIQNAVDLAYQNNITHIKELSHIVR